MHYYGVNLRDLFLEEAPLTPLEALNLIMFLPADSAFVAEKRGGQQYRGWDDDRYMNALVANELRVLRYMYSASHSKRPPKAPEPIPTPDSAKKKTSRDGGMFRRIAEARLEAVRKAKEGM